MLDPKEELNRIESLNQKLYNKDQKNLPQTRRGMLHTIKRNVSGLWTTKTAPEVKRHIQTLATNTPVFKRFFLVSIVIFVLALGFGAYKFFGGSNIVSGDNININILGNAFTPGGEELSLTVEIANRNATGLEYADLITEYARSGDTGNPEDKNRERKTIGTIGAGKVSAQKVVATLYGEEGSTRDIVFTLQYRVAGSNAIFEKTKSYTVTINTAPVSLSVDASKTTSSGQNYVLKVNISSSAKKPVTGMLLRIEYPTGYEFTSATPTPSYLSNVWDIGDIAAGETKQISISGILTGQDKEERSFRMYVGSADSVDTNTIQTIYNSFLHTVTIEKPFIQALLVINGSSEKIVSVAPRSTIHAEVKWANNLPTRITDAEITAQLVGDLIDQSTVQPSSGFYNSAENKIYWGKDTSPTLASIEPGESGTLGFTFTTYPLYRNGTLETNPEVTISVSIKGKQPAQGNVVQSVDSFEQKTIHFNSDFQLSGQSYYRSGPFTNTGPLPPQANQKTTYTIKWVITNSSNQLNDAVVRSSLPPYVHFLGTVSPSTENVSIDPVNGDLVWKAGTVTSGQGYTSDAKIVYFQIEFNPSISQVGQTPSLVLESTATATDAFTTTSLSSKINAITTRIYNDVGYIPGDEKVVN